MTTTYDSTVTADDLWSIVSEVWTSILGDEPRRSEHAFDLEGSLTSAVAISGDWDGVVTFTCPPAAATAVARAMLALDDDAEVSGEDVTDALGEVANVVGGQVKALCAGDNRLGLPVVGHGMALPHAQPCCRMGMEWAGHVARIAVWRSTAPAVGTADGGGR